LAITKFRSLHIEPLPLEKIPLLTPLVLGDDYLKKPLENSKD
jgi:hypothetical protein